MEKTCEAKVVFKVSSTIICATSRQPLVVRGLTEYDDGGKGNDKGFDYLTRRKHERDDTQKRAQSTEHHGGSHCSKDVLGLGISAWLCTLKISESNYENVRIKEEKRKRW